jgi:hypothetical protein
MSENQVSALLALLFLTLPTLAIQAQTGFPVIKPSNAADELYALKKKNPRISAAALAAYGNALIRKKGYDFSIPDCAIAEANGKSGDSDETNYETAKPFKYDLEILRRGTKTFQIMSKDWGAPCDCSFDLAS